MATQTEATADSTLAAGVGNQNLTKADWLLLSSVVVLAPMLFAQVQALWSKTHTFQFFPYCDSRCVMADQVAWSIWNHGFGRA